MSDRDDDSTMDVLSSSRCYRLLAERSVGRIGVVSDGYPVIIPVNYAMDGETVVVRTARGSVVGRADLTKASFQIDQFDPKRKSGWSVLLRGQLNALTVEDRNELIERTRATGVSPWAPGEHDLWMRISPEDVSGRQIEPGYSMDWRLGTAAYM
ncbi:MAG: pyridoxamine 5'-phosphate oxidase family protein [Nakamurella sp.]